MNKVMAMTALAAGLLVSTAAISAPAELAGAFAPKGAVTLVRGGGGGPMGGGGGHMSGGGGHMGGAPWGGTGAHFSGNGHIGGAGRPLGGPGTHFGANDHFGNGHGHFDHDHGHRGRFIPGDVFAYGGYGDYDYGYAGDCNWLRRQATVTGSRYWWHRYQACLY